LPAPNWPKNAGTLIPLPSVNPLSEHAALMLLDLSVAARSRQGDCVAR